MSPLFKTTKVGWKYDVTLLTDAYACSTKMNVPTFILKLLYYFIFNVNAIN